MAESDSGGLDTSSHYTYPNKGICDFCDGTNVRIRVEDETLVPYGKGGSRPAHICAACDG